jgi:hypothetical protein
MAEKKIIPVKYFYYGMAGCLVFIGAVFFFLWLRESNANKALDERGITVDAWVVRMYETKVSRKSAPNYFMDVGFFADTTKVPEVISNDTLPEAQTESDKLLASISKQTASLKQPLGDYETQTIPLPGYEVYKKYNINDKVKVQFLPDDYSVVRLVRK